MVTPRRSLIRPSISHTATRETGSSPVVGSSRKKIFGECTRPRAISNRRRIPPDKGFVCAPRHPPRQGLRLPPAPFGDPPLLQHLFDRAFALSLGHPLHLRVDVEVLIQ